MQGSPMVNGIRCIRGVQYSKLVVCAGVWITDGSNSYFRINQGMLDELNQRGGWLHGFCYHHPSMEMVMYSSVGIE